MLAPKTIEIPEEFSDSVTLKKYLEVSEKHLAEAYILVLKMQELSQIKDERIITNVADSWHYALEALRLIDG